MPHTSVQAAEFRDGQVDAVQRQALAQPVVGDPGLRLQLLQGPERNGLGLLDLVEVPFGSRVGSELADVCINLRREAKIQEK